MFLSADEKKNNYPVIFFHLPTVCRFGPSVWHRPTSYEKQAIQTRPTVRRSWVDHQPMTILSADYLQTVGRLNSLSVVDRPIDGPHKPRPHISITFMYSCVWYSFVHSVSSRYYAPWTSQIRHNIVSTVCPSLSYVQRFLGLTSTKQVVNVTCSMPQRTAPRPDLEPGSTWSVIRGPTTASELPPMYTYLDIFVFSECRKRLSTNH